jgi:hypothetical protein
MEGLSKHSRLRTAAIAALVASGLVLMSMSGSTSAMSRSKRLVVKNISLGIRNSSNTAIKVQVCRNNHATNPASTGRSNSKPCSEITETYVVGSGQRQIVPNSNPVGVIITPYCAFGSCPELEKTLYFYAENQFLSPPFFFTDDHRLEFSEHEVHLRWQHGVHYELRRYADEDRDGEHVKLMRIEILKWPAYTPCAHRASGAAPRLPGC